MVRACLAPSDNNVAEHLLLMAGSKPNDDYPAARRALTEFLEGTVGTPPFDIIPYDGSGLSRHNLVTARALARLLAWCDAQPTSDLWRASLALPGQPGTLRNRLAGVNFAGKTGSLNHVSSLSGYVGDRTVVIMMNHFRGSAEAAREIQDAIVRRVASEALLGRKWMRQRPWV
jgi:D-alanyl-D-alanine carboxypeptidase/D-alanyl-D-alanine-endopeptidase (penicillin-binding protein 4)